jgi:hypothetical protein
LLEVFGEDGLGRFMAEEYFVLGAWKEP